MQQSRGNLESNWEDEKTYLLSRASGLMPTHPNRLRNLLLRNTLDWRETIQMYNSQLLLQRRDFMPPCFPP
ncbi:hypothetical protein ACRRTK_002449 [Alexandromys fortis]